MDIWRKLCLIALLVVCVSFSAMADGYKRSHWKHWTDKDRDCLSVRHELLVHESIERVKYDDRGCRVVKGLWYDPYTGTIFTNPSGLDMEHLIPLEYAHSHGGSNWSKKLKERFANDFLNLALVDLSQNRQRGSKGASQWQPLNEAYHCEWAQRQLSVGERYKTFGFYFDDIDKIWLMNKVNECNE